MRNRFSLAVLLTLMSIGVAYAQTYKYSTLYAFQANGKDPRNPNSLIIDPQGNLYGTSNIGGVFKHGSVFAVSPQGALTVLHSFDASAVNPTYLARDGEGNLYGATLYEARVSASELFKLSPSNNGSYNFGVLSVSSNEYTQVAVNPAGSVVGLDCSQSDGGPDCSSNSSLFAINAGGQFTTLWTLSDLDFWPQGSLVIDQQKNVYGTITGNGIAGDYGYVFEFSQQSGFSILHTFDGTDGSFPVALALDATGNLYGVTNGSTNNSGAGTAFKISPTTGFSTVYAFCSLANCADGTYPGSIVLDAQGNIYGTALSLVFKITPAGNERVIYNSGAPFVGNGLVIDKGGNLYGFKQGGAQGSLGSIYRLSRSN